jgi:hypothetical protein
MVEATSAYLCENSPAMLELEGIVDQAALRNVLLALEQIYSLPNPASNSTKDRSPTDLIEWCAALLTNAQQRRA